jgi:lipoprotein-anchoring transpeptidase ErfK/SrfK
MKGLRLLAGSAIFLCRATAAPDSAEQTAGDQNPKPPPLKHAGDLIRKQDPPIVTRGVAEKVTPTNARIVVNLALQRATLLAGDTVYIDTPVSTGKTAVPTPRGKFTILEKELERHASTYGDFVDGKKRVVSSGVSMKVDSAPSNSRFVPAPMRYFCRFNDEGFGLHAGILPGYPASHGCVRVPEEIAKIFFEKVKVGTPVEIIAE